MVSRRWYRSTSRRAAREIRGRDVQRGLRPLVRVGDVVGLVEAEPVGLGPVRVEETAELVTLDHRRAAGGR